MIDIYVITPQTLQHAKLAYFLIERGRKNVRTIEDIAEVAANELATFHGYMEHYVTLGARDQFISEIRDYLIREGRAAMRAKTTFPPGD